MLNVRLACDHLFGKLLFTWLSLVMSMMVSFVLSFFPRDVLDEILNLIESVSEDFPSYSLTVVVLHSCSSQQTETWDSCSIPCFCVHFSSAETVILFRRFYHWPLFSQFWDFSEF